MHIHYRKISVKFCKSFQLLPWQLNLNRSAGCNLDPFFLKLCWNSAFQYSSISFCSENENISQRAAIGFVWHYGQFLSIVVVYTSWIRRDDSRTGFLFSSSALELLMKLVIPPIHTEEQVWKFYLYFSNYVTELYDFCLYSLCMLSSTLMFNKIRWKFHSMAYPDPVDELVAIPWPSPFPFIIKSETETTSRLL